MIIKPHDTIVRHRGIEAVATALSKSDDDGDKSEHPQAIEHLKIIAGQIWRNPHAAARILSCGIFIIQ